MSYKICAICPGQEDCPHKDNRTECWEFAEAVKRHRPSIIAEIWEERDRQDEKWGEQNHPMIDDSFFHLEAKETLLWLRETNSEKNRCWYNILYEEVLEAFLEGDPAKQRKELIQVAAVAVAIIECLDRKK